MNRATTSLPVPDSPVISTVVSVAATCVALRSTSRHSADSPTTRTVRPRRHAFDGSLHGRVDPLPPVVVDLRDRLPAVPALCPEAEVVRDPTRERHVRGLNASGRFDQNATRTRGSGARVDSPRTER